MKIKSLLAAVSMAAIAASSASALDIPTISVIPAGIIPALELEIPGTPALVGGPYSFDVTTDIAGGANYPTGNNLIVDVTLPPGVYFAAPVSASNVTAVLASVTHQAGGAAGQNTAQFLVSTDQTTPINTINFGGFTLGLNACPSAGDVLRVDIATEVGTPIEEGFATSANLIAPCQSALDGVVLSDEAISDTTILLAPPGYTTIGELLGTGPLNPLGTLGSVNYTVDPTVSTSLSALVPLDVTGTATSDVAQIQFDIMFAGDTTRITSVTVGGIAAVQSTTNPQIFTLTATGPADIPTLTDGVADDVVITVGGLATDPLIPTQTVMVGNAVVTFRAIGAPDMIVSEPGAMGGLDTLQREGREFGFFDWNSGGDGAGTVSVYRITGLSGPTDFTIQVENSNANGTYRGVVTPDATGEGVLFSTDMGGALPAGVVRFDAKITLETADLGVDIDRLLITGGIVSAFGDGANITNSGAVDQPTNDTDNGGFGTE